MEAARLLLDLDEWDAADQDQLRHPGDAAQAARKVVASVPQVQLGRDVQSSPTIGIGTGSSVTRLP